MSTLIHAPQACSLATKIAAVEGDVNLNYDHVNLFTKEMSGNRSLLDFNPLGQVSVIITDQKEIITETAVCLLWVQNESTRKDFHISADDPKYFQLLRWLSFCSTELHKQIFRIVFYNEATQDVKDNFRELAASRLKVLDDHLADSEFMLGEQFSAVDAYLAWFFMLSDGSGVHTNNFQQLQRYRESLLTRPLIKELMEYENCLSDEIYNKNIL